MWEETAPPDFLWHYTNAESVIGIVKNKAIWCTEYRYLNDKREISTFATHLIARMREELKQLFGQDESDRIADLVSGLYNTWNVFICSFCVDEDRNEHWFQYAGRAGYSLGFDTRKLREIALAQGFTLGPVLYGEERTLAIATAVLRDNLHKLSTLRKPLNQDDLRNVVNFLCRLILSYAPFFKSGSFQLEREWRLVRATGIEGDGQMEFRSKSPFGLVAYCKFNLAPRLDGEAPSKPGSNPLIPRVTIGPGNETDELTRSSHTYELFAHNGFEILVGETKSSLRF